MSPTRPAAASDSDDDGTSRGTDAPIMQIAPAGTLEEVVSRLSSGYRSIGDMVCEVLREAILSGTFPPGERLRQEALATAIGVSRLPVRSALIQLDNEGLVDFHQRRGAVVKTLSRAQVQEIFELRELLEPYALRKSMAWMTTERVIRLRHQAALLDAQEEGASFVDLRVSFYRELYGAERNSRLVEMIEALRKSLGLYLLGKRISGSHDGSGRHHELVEHVAAGDMDAAERWLREHLHTVRGGIEGALPT